MALPMAITTIKVMRVPGDEARDPLDEQPPAEVIASGVRAVISTGSGQEINASGASQTVMTFRLDCDPTDITNTDTVEDERTGEIYEVTTVVKRLDLSGSPYYMQGQLKQVTGVVSRRRNV